ncbi:Sec-independent protein translocase subunit TatA/TatB [Haloplanus sp. C73]|uniref:Sec-independent protein translocase subunit TatA/TatB n=1 Tax=Haloplanus sp. C73 TaxID=3421641 RepID=UPI003EBE903A
MQNAIVPLFPGLPGGPELLIVLFVLVLLFGANKIPKLARSTGQAMGEFKRGREELEQELQEGSEDGSSDTDASSTESATESETTTDTETTADTEKSN